MALSTMLATLYHFITRLFLASDLESVRISTTDETLIYFSINLLTGFLVGVTVAVSEASNKVDYVDSKGIVNSIGIWFLNALLLAAIGFYWGRGSHGSPASNEARVPLAQESPYTEKL
jgi:hypothetical protein